MWTELANALIPKAAELVAGAAMLIVANEARKLRPKFAAWMDTHTTTKQRQMLHDWAAEAVALGEMAYKDLGGAEKLEAAKGYIDIQLKKHGLTFTVDDIRAAIEKAYLQTKQSA